MEIIELNDYLFPAPCTIMVAGPSGSGKTTLVMEILRYCQQLFSQSVSGVIYCYTEMQEAFKDPPGGPVMFHYRLPNDEELEQYIQSFVGSFFLLVFDDLMTEVAQSAIAQNIVTKMAHHRHFGAINLMQNIFVQGKKARSQALNSQYYLLTRTTQDLKQVAVLGSQMFPSKGKEFIEIYQDAVENPLHKDIPPHLLISCHPFHMARKCQLLAGILPQDGTKILYVF